MSGQFTEILYQVDTLTSSAHKLDGNHRIKQIETRCYKQTNMQLNIFCFVAFVFL